LKEFEGFIGQILFYGSKGILVKVGNEKCADGAKKTFLIGKG